MEIYEDESLTSKDDIVSHFEDCGHEFFECGQGYFQEEAEVFIKVGGEHFIVNMTGECVGTWQDRGDKLYHVEDITVVTYEKISNESLNEILNKNTLRAIEHHESEIVRLRAKLI